jgi:hypothetical protein
VSGCQRAPGLRLDGDGRDVVADRVVQLARELVALAELACSMSRMRALAR